MTWSSCIICGDPSKACNGIYCAKHTMVNVKCAGCNQVFTVKRRRTKPPPTSCSKECKVLSKLDFRARDPILEVQYAHFFSMVGVNYRRNSVDAPPERVRIHEIAQRRCLGCRVMFRSLGKGHRRCAECANTNEITDFRKQKGLRQ